MDTTMHIDEKNVRECKGCARFPMARIVVSAKKRAWSIIPGPQERFTYKLLKHPKLQLTQPFKVFLNLEFEIEVINVPNGDQSFSLSSFLHRTYSGSLKIGCRIDGYKIAS